MDLPTIIALIVIVGIVLALVIKLIIDKKQGKTSCSCGCGGCAMKDMCHSQENKNEQSSPNEQEKSEEKSE